MEWLKTTAIGALLTTASACTTAYAQKPADPSAVKAAETESQMTNEERTQLTLGLMAMEFGGVKKPEGAIPGAGYVPGIPRLSVPPLRESDASLGVTWIGGARGDGATALPSGTAQGATWNPDLIEQGGRMIGSEARMKGFNVLLAGGINLMRDPRNGRTFEYLGEDPLLSGILGAAAVNGIQSQKVISTLKHFAINPQETGRHFMNVEIDEASLRESDLLAFEIAIERSNPGSLMCAYNRINGPLSCGSQFLLTDVLRDDWGYKGFVMSDWGAVEGLDFALAGLDQQSGAQLDEGLFFGTPLLEAANSDPAYQERLGQMARNILYPMYNVGIGDQPPAKTDAEAPDGGEIALQVAQEGIVLLKNAGGSSRVMGDDGPAITIPVIRAGDTGFSAFFDRMYHRSAPLTAIQEASGDTAITFRDGRYASEAARAASKADVAIVFATQYQTEGFDVPDLTLPGGQDDLIAAVAAANPNTIVVLETGGPVEMPWLDDVAAVLEAWYPGAKGGEAIADILFGEVSPSGHLPITFPASVDQLPRPQLPGSDTVEPSFLGSGKPGQTLDADYSIEGSDIGYRWFARQNYKALFPFGFGLSYTSFENDGLSVARKKEGIIANFRMQNTGETAGADVAQLYLISGPGGNKQRLVGFAKRELAAGESTAVEMSLDPRLLGEWQNDGWTIAGGTYAFALGKDAETLGEVVTVTLPASRLNASGKPE